MACNVSSFSVGGGRELLATVTTTHTEISDATLLQWKNKYRYLYVVFDGSQRNSYHYLFPFIIESGDFYDFYSGDTANPRSLGRNAGSGPMETLVKTSKDASVPYNSKYYADGNDATVKIYGLTF